LLPTTLLSGRLVKHGLVIVHPSTAAGLNLADGKAATLQVNGVDCSVTVGWMPLFRRDCPGSPQRGFLPVTAPVRVAPDPDGLSGQVGTGEWP